jgi:fumagillin biosynthesis monooxygenase
MLGLYSIIFTVAESTRGTSSTYMKNVILGRSSSQLPNPDGQFGSTPAAHPIVVFHFGVRFNHPLGILSPGAQMMVSYFLKCNEEIMARSTEFGMLGISAWRGAERSTQNTLMQIYYFRDVEGLNRFAHDKIHREAWDWVQKAGHKHIGFFHEVFCTPQKSYESIYVNFQPLLMGATSVNCEDTDEEKDGGPWVQALVNADVGPLKSQFARMNRSFKEVTG